MPQYRRLFIAPFLMFVAAAWSADPASCTSVESPTERLKCYDAAHGRSEAKPAAVAVPVVAPEAAAAQAEAEFGMDKRQRRETEEAPTKIDAAISQATKDALGYFTLVLENGQHWRVTETGRHISFKPGDQVTIRRGALGSHLLTRGNGGAALRTKRIE